MHTVSVIILHPMKKLLSLLMLATMALITTAPAEDAAKTTPYPLKTCVVSGEPLGTMGKPYVFTHEGQEVQLCCKRCEKKFNADSTKYMKELEAAQKEKAN